MHISLHKKSPIEAAIAIKIEKADYQPHVEKKIKEYSRKASIKGFRPGNVPQPLIRQMYGKLILMEEVHALLADALTKYLQESELDVLGEPIAETEKTEELNWEQQQDFEFIYAIGMVAPFSCTLSKDIKITEYEVANVSEQTVDELIEQLRKVYGDLDLVVKSEVGDTLYGELHCPEQDFKAQVKIELQETASQCFIGLGPREKVALDVQEAFKQGVKLIGVPARVHKAMLKIGGQAEFIVEQVHRVTAAILDQNFFDKVLGKGVVKSEKELRERLRERIIQSKQQEANTCLVQALQEKILEKAAIVLPENFLKRLLRQKNSAMSQEQLEAYYPQYAQELKWKLVVEKFIKEHNLQASHEEVVEEAKQRFQSIFNSGQYTEQLQGGGVDELIQLFLQEDKDKNYRQIYESIIAHKLLNLIKSQISIDLQEISVEAFDQLALN